MRYTNKGLQPLYCCRRTLGEIFVFSWITTQLLIYDWHHNVLCYNNSPNRSVRGRRSTRADWTITACTGHRADCWVNGFATAIRTTACPVRRTTACPMKGLRWAREWGRTWADDGARSPSGRRRTHTFCRTRLTAGRHDWEDGSWRRKIPIRPAPTSTRCPTATCTCPVIADSADRWAVGRQNRSNCRRRARPTTTAEFDRNAEAFRCIQPRSDPGGQMRCPYLPCRPTTNTSVSSWWKTQFFSRSAKMKNRDFSGTVANSVSAFPSFTLSRIVRKIFNSKLFLTKLLAK